jgi:hypothetical protein
VSEHALRREGRCNYSGSYSARVLQAVIVGYSEQCAVGTVGKYAVDTVGAHSEYIPGTLDLVLGYPRIHSRATS